MKVQPLLVFVVLTSLVSRALGELVIGSFNVQVFGRTKAKKHDVMEALVQILSRYDVVLVQEVRDKSGIALRKLTAALNSYKMNEMDPYSLVTSVPLGRSRSKEQYAFFYRPSKVRVCGTYQFTNRRRHRYERPPFAVKLCVNPAVESSVRTFGFVGLHAQPSNVFNELKELVKGFNYLSRRKWKLKDFVIGGDLNADCSYLKESEMRKVTLRRSRRFTWVIKDHVDTTSSRTHCAYDRFILSGADMRRACVDDACGSVYDFAEDMGLSEKQARQISDHYPIELRLN